MFWATKMNWLKVIREAAEGDYNYKWVNLWNFAFFAYVGSQCVCTYVSVPHNTQHHLMSWFRICTRHSPCKGLSNSNTKQTAANQINNMPTWCLPATTPYSKIRSNAAWGGQKAFMCLFCVLLSPWKSPTICLSKKVSCLLLVSSRE